MKWDVYKRQSLRYLLLQQANICLLLLLRVELIKVQPTNVRLFFSSTFPHVLTSIRRTPLDGLSSLPNDCTYLSDWTNITPIFILSTSVSNLRLHVKIIMEATHCFSYLNFTNLSLLCKGCALWCIHADRLLGGNSDIPALCLL